MDGDQDQFHSTQFQRRAFHFFKTFALRTRGSGRRPKDALSPVAIPSHNFQRAHSSVDLLRKPDISPLIGLRAEDGPNPMDADDSSPDPSASGNSPRIRSRCHSAWDSFHAPPIHSTFAARGPAPLFFRDHAAPPSEVDSGNVLAPAPLFLRSALSLHTVVQPSPKSPILHPDTTPQIGVGSEPEPHGQAVHNTLDDDITRPLGDVNASPLADPAPTPSSLPGDILRFHSAPAPTPEMIPERPVLIPRHSAPLPPPFRLATERGLRLSPSIVARQPMPILNLPTLPPPSAPHPAQDSPTRQNLPLRSIPSLPRHGHSNTEREADHENATLVDSDENEDEEGEDEEPTGVLSVHQSDEEEEEPQSVDLSGVHGIKSLQKRPMRDECFVDAPSSPQSEPTSSNLVDYFNSKTYVDPIQMTASPASLAIHPFSPKSELGDVNQRHTVDPDSPIREVRKPSLYHATSRSMIDLGVTRRTERHFRSGEMAATNLPSIPGYTAEAQVESEENGAEVVVGRLLRRTSMPSFHPTSDPPPYPTFNPRESRDMLPDDEERLPTYSNSLYLIAVMPRKLEFTSPGVQAKDRKWRRVVCELEGTTFRVYKCPPGASGAGVLGDWWEKRVGVGDVASPDRPRTRKKEEQFELPTKLGIDDVPAQPVPSGRSTPVPPGGEIWPRTESQSSIGTTPRATKRISGASFLSPFRSSSSSRSETNAAETVRAEMHESRSSLAHESAGRSTPATQQLSQPLQPRSAARLTFLPVGTGRAQLRNGEIAKPPQSDLIRAYTLQHAESGLGNDYLKRKNVIRVRLEGEQFLLQAPDTPAVVEWIEGLHAGTSIALDLDQRPMPRGPLFPRRRRRRARRAQGEERTL